MSRKERKPFLDRFWTFKSPILQLIISIFQLVCAGFFIYTTVIFWIKFVGIDGSLIEFSWANGFNVSKGGQLVHAILFTFISLISLVIPLLNLIDYETTPTWICDTLEFLTSQLFVYPAGFGILAFILGYIIQYANGWNTFENSWFIFIPLCTFLGVFVIQCINIDNTNY